MSAKKFIPSLRLKTALAGLFLAVSAHAQIYTLDSTDRGWYSSAGFHFSNNDNHLAGRYLLSDYRSFFVFDGSSVVGDIVSAELRLFVPNGGFSSNSPTETFNIFNVVTSIPSLVSSNAFALSTFADLGNGPNYGNASLGESSEGSFVSIALNPAFFSYFNNNVSGLFALGGAVSSLSGLNNQYIFGGSDTGNPADGRTQLILRSVGEANSPVPEPSTYGAVAAGLLLVGVALRRRITAKKA